MTSQRQSYSPDLKRVTVDWLRIQTIFLTRRLDSFYLMALGKLKYHSAAPTQPSPCYFLRICLASAKISGGPDEYCQNFVGRLRTLQPLAASRQDGQIACFDDSHLAHSDAVHQPRRSADQPG